MERAFVLRRRPDSKGSVRVDLDSCPLPVYVRKVETLSRPPAVDHDLEETTVDTINPETRTTEDESARVIRNVLEPVITGERFRNAVCREGYFFFGLEADLLRQDRGFDVGKIIDPDDRLRRRRNLAPLLRRQFYPLDDCRGRSWQKLETPELRGDDILLLRTGKLEAFDRPRQVEYVQYEFPAENLLEQAEGKAANRAKDEGVFDFEPAERRAVLPALGIAVPRCDIYQDDARRFADGAQLVDQVQGCLQIVVYADDADGYDILRSQLPGHSNCYAGSCILIPAIGDETEQSFLSHFFVPPSDLIGLSSNTSFGLKKYLMIDLIF